MMAHFGVLCLPVPSHMNLFMALGCVLLNRNHRVTFFTLPELQPVVREQGFGFCPIEPSSVPSGTLARLLWQQGESGPFASVRVGIRFDRLLYEGVLEQGPALLKAAAVDSLIVDQAEACGGSVADCLGVPWVSICNGLCQNSEPDVPPFFTHWDYRPGYWARMRNRVAYAVAALLTRPIQNLINTYRKRWALPPVSRLDDTFSPFAQISQQSPQFDFPRRKLPGVFHYVGPIRGPVTANIQFPWERLDGRPLIYAALGTLVNRHSHLYAAIAQACKGLDAQLVLSLGGADALSVPPLLAPSAVVVPFAPQRELLARAALTITHAGLNTTLESLSAGVPLVAIPIAFEQPAIAARIRWTGAGDSVPASRVTPQRLRSAIERVLGNPSYRTAAEHLQRSLVKTGGVSQAADIVERVALTRKPVFANGLQKPAPHRR